MLNPVVSDLFNALRIVQAALKVLGTLEQDKTVHVAKSVFINILVWSENQELTSDLIFHQLLGELKEKVLNAEESSPDLQQRVLSVAMIALLTVRGVTESNEGLTDTASSVLQLAKELLFIKQTNLLDSPYWKGIFEKNEFFNLLSQAEINENMDKKNILEKLLPFIREVDALVESGGAPNLCRYLEGILSDDKFRAFVPLLRSVSNLLQSVEFDYHAEEAPTINHVD
jgi:hypothetical protein